MPRRLHVALSLLGIAGLLAVAAPQAGAAVTLGGTTGMSGICTGGIGINLYQATLAPNSPSYSVPAGGGVIVSWSHRAGPTGAGQVLRFKVWRATGNPDEFSVVGESGAQPITESVLNTFPVQPAIPVQAGDIIGLRQEPSSTATVCVIGGILGDQTRFGTTAANPGPGQTATMPSAAGGNARVNVSAVLEPDCDLDQLGDESQDPDTLSCGATCQGRAATIAGTRGPDELVGTPEADVIQAFGSADAVAGGGGRDLICGGGGTDTLRGNASADTLVGGPDSDRLFGGAGKDVLIGGSPGQRAPLLDGVVDRCPKAERDRRRGCHLRG
jgi:hypothetical protein